MALELSKAASQMAKAAEKVSERQSVGGDQTASAGDAQTHDASKHDASRFREAMNQQPQAAENVRQSQPAKASQVAPSEGTRPASMGDAILDKLQQVSQRNMESLKSVENIASSDDNISVSSMIEAQTELMKVQLTQEVESKAEGKLDQTAETLLKS